MNIEPLESRIAPAAVFTYTDVDGDLVTITTSKGTNADLQAIVQPFLTGSGTIGQQLTQIDFSSNPSVFGGTDLTITARPQDLTPSDHNPAKSGDGLANIGYVDATGSDDGTSINLGTVKIAGDLGLIAAGNDPDSGPAVKSLSLNSLGQYRTKTGAPSNDSIINGTIASLATKAESYGGSFTTLAGSGGDIGSLTIGGSILGTGIAADGAIGAIKVAGDLYAGYIVSNNGPIASLTVGGSCLNEQITAYKGQFGPIKVAGDFNGFLSARGGGMTSISIGGDLGGNSSSSIFSHGKITRVTIGGSIGTGDEGSSRISTEAGFGGDIGTVIVGGSVRGASLNDSGRIAADGSIGMIRIGHDLVGGAGLRSGTITAKGAITSLTIGGSVIGGVDLAGDSTMDATDSGAITAASMGSIKIIGSLLGSNAARTGLVESTGGITSIVIGGSVVAGTISGDAVPSENGLIHATGAIGSVSIGHDLKAISTYTGYPSLVTDTGSVQAKRISSVFIGGSVYGGSGSGVLRSGEISADFDLGRVTVKHDLLAALITAVGQETLTSANSDLALKSLTVGGRVQDTYIDLGYNKYSQGQNADAQAGAINVKGAWVQSTIVAGIDPVDGLTGDSADHKLNAPARDNVNIHSKIASIIIGGAVTGNLLTGSAVFGFAAEEIGSFKYHGLVVPLAPGPHNDTFALGQAHPVGPSLSPTNGDGFGVHVFEV